MTTTELTIQASADDVFAVLSDGWMYAGWVVGASHMRDVDDEWPQPGSCIHHSIGAWPALIADTTEVVALQPGRLLELDARAFPLGRAFVRVELFPAGERTRVVMTETVTGGPGRAVPEPAFGPLLRARNRESLRRLADIARGRHGRRRRAGAPSSDRVPSS